MKVRTAHLRNGNTTSCGCFQDQRRSEVHWKHGHGYRTPEYNCWNSMINRCSSDAYHARNYKPKGITVCERWKDFRNFLADLGQRPSARHSLDRIDPFGNYEPGNVRWATPTQQARNKSNNVRVQYRGEMKLIYDLPNPHGLPYHMIYSRIFSYGYSVDEAIGSPRGKIRTYYKGKRGSPASKERSVQRDAALASRLQRP